MRVSAFAFASLLPAVALAHVPLSAAPAAYIDIPAIWNSAVDRSHTRAFGIGVEIPWCERYAAIARAHSLHVRQGPYEDFDGAGAFYALGNPKTFWMWEFQASARTYPWEWLPGFFAEALGGYKWALGRNPDASSGSGAGIHRPAEIRSFTTRAYAVGAGFGYRWIWGPSRLVLGFAFGPEWVFREGKDADGGLRPQRDMGDDLLRFNSLEAGFGF
jgi:hypothetical protein